MEMPKTVAELEQELESLWVDYEKLMADSMIKTDRLILARREIRALRERIVRK
jgi:hypothetical protein